MVNKAILGIGMAIRSLTRLSRPGPYKVVQNRDQGCFSGNTENTLFLSDSIRVDLNIDQERNQETHIFKIFENGHFSAMRPQYDRPAQNLHMMTGSYAYATVVSLTSSQVDIQLKTTHCHSNLLKHKTCFICSTR